MKHIVSFSGGKDSTAMLLRMIELKMPIDEVRYFDCGSWEFPQMKEHIGKVREILPLPLTKIEPVTSFDGLFTRIGYGFPRFKGNWCTGGKRDGLKRGLPKDSLVYIGYSADELKRTENKVADGKVFPLIEWGWHEEDCLEYCYRKGFDWGGLYNYFDRVSCWCCPFQNLKELRNLRKYFPDLWKRLLEMQSATDSTFRSDGTTVFDLDRRFAEEDKQTKFWQL